jgi:hypothetical protein
MAIVVIAVSIGSSACSPNGSRAADNAVPVSDAPGTETASASVMPADWEVVADIQMPAGEVQTISANLSADLTSVQNTIYMVRGKRVQVNVMIVPDSATADKLMVKLLTMKGAEFFLRKDLKIYEFVGTNDVIPEMAEGRKHLESI